MLIFQNNKRKFYQQVGGEYMRTNQQLDAKERKQFWSQVREQKEHNRKAEWINNMKNKLQRLEEGPAWAYTWNLSEQHSKTTEQENIWL